MCRQPFKSIDGTLHNRGRERERDRWCLILYAERDRHFTLLTHPPAPDPSWPFIIPYIPYSLPASLPACLPPFLLQDDDDETAATAIIYLISVISLSLFSFFSLYDGHLGWHLDAHILDRWTEHIVSQRGEEDDEEEEEDGASKGMAHTWFDWGATDSTRDVDGSLNVRSLY